MNKMFRGTFYAVVIVLSIQLVSSTVTSSRDSRTPTSSTLRNRRNTNEDSKLDLDLPQGREIGTVLFTIKNQFREIIGDILSEVCKFVKNILYQFKMNLLKKFESYTLSNLLRVVINGISDTAPDFDTELSLDSGVETVQMEYDYTNPYAGLASLFGDHIK